jgi:hypothetical protein
LALCIADFLHSLGIEHQLFAKPMSGSGLRSSATAKQSVGTEVILKSVLEQQANHSSVCHCTFCMPNRDEAEQKNRRQELHAIKLLSSGGWDCATAGALRISAPHPQQKGPPVRACAAFVAVVCHAGFPLLIHRFIRCSLTGSLTSAREYQCAACRDFFLCVT